MTGGLIAYDPKDPSVPIVVFRLDDHVAIIKALQAGLLTRERAPKVWKQVILSGKTATEVMIEMGIHQLDDAEMIAIAREVLAANPKIADELKAGNTKGLGRLVGQAKKKDPNINPKRFQEICLDIIAQE
jgi:aspartyl-tRNA(Asn)/glutamyl-tRNA(Gln) amidotransferase subunit B